MRYFSYFIYLPVFSYISLNFFKIIILNSLPGNSQISISLGLVLLVSFSGVMFARLLFVETCFYVFEGVNTSFRFYRQFWVSKDLLLVPWVDWIIFGITVLLGGSQVMRLHL